MKNGFILLFAILIISLSLQAQETYSRVKVFGTHQELQQLGDLGLPVDHGEYKENTWFMTDFSASDIGLLDSAGFTYEIVIPDVKAYYIEHSNDPLTKQDRSSCAAILQEFCSSCNGNE